MKKTTSLSARTNLFFLAGIAVFTLTLILILHISSGRLLYNWQKMETEAMHEYVEKTLSDLIAQSDNPYKKISSTEINDALADFPYPPKRLIITDPDYNILYVYRQNRSGGAGRQMQNTMRFMQDIDSWRPITNNSGRTLFFYHLRIPEFTETRSNHKLLKSFRLALSLAAFVSFALAFFASRFFSGGIKKQTNSLVAVLESALFLVAVFFTVSYYTGKKFEVKEKSEISMNSTIHETSNILGISEEEILQKLGLPETFQTDTKLIDIEDEYEDITWAYIKDRLINDTLSE
jgi:hypothetical protein